MSCPDLSLQSSITLGNPPGLEDSPLSADLTFLEVSEMRSESNVHKQVADYLIGTFVKPKRATIVAPKEHSLSLSKNQFPNRNKESKHTIASTKYNTE